MAAGARLASQSEHAGRTTDALWLSILERICSLAAHEVRGALNGVSVNLEVVRSRSQKPTGELSSVRQFAAAAADQFDAVITMTDALLSLARPAAEPVDVGQVVRRIDALLAPAARADGKQFELDGAFQELGVTSATGSAVRAAIGGCWLAALDASTEVRCSAVSGATPEVRIETMNGSAVTIDDQLIAAVAAAGIRVMAEPSVIVISFPR